MRPPSPRVAARRRRVLALACFALLLGVIVMIARPVPAASAEAGGALVAEPVLGPAAAGAQTLFGASPGEAPGEVWGAGEGSRETGSIVRYTDEGGWETVPPPVDSEGKPVEFSRTSVPRAATAGRTTAAGGVVMVAALGQNNSREPQVLLVRDPGGQFRAVEPPESALASGESLFGLGPTGIKIAAVEEAGGKTGAFVVPEATLTNAVLHYDGSEWKREPVCVNFSGEACEEPTTGFSVLAIGASGPGNAWLLAKRTVFREEGEAIVLLRREGGEWRPQKLGGPLGELFTLEKPQPGGVEATVAERETGQPLTVAARGLWVDATVSAGGETSAATLYYDTDVGDPRQGQVTGSWCDLEGPAAAMCSSKFGFEMPKGESRSFAWSGNGGSGPAEEFGARAITGAGNGAMLVFENGAWSKIPLAGNGGTSAGGALAYPEKEGGSGGLEGWIGPSYRLTREPVPSGLQSWPVPFRRPLTAVAPEPGAPIGGLESEAIAVGDEGQAARYEPGVGWQAETLLTGSGERATPDLRAVAWPEPETAYAVGNEGAMWVWRKATGLWESDPGAPLKLVRNNFTGIAFDPNEPTRGYAVGEQGLLLGLGNDAGEGSSKSWVQEPLPAELNPEINITSIAFAGGEALATYSVGVSQGADRSPKFEGGLIADDGSGWRVDEEAEEVLEGAESGQSTVAPRRIAGLPDGGAVIVGAQGAVIEREGPGTPWHAVPGGPVGFPDAVAAFREGGQVRALVAVGEASGDVEGADGEQALGQPGPGLPPLLTKPYPLPKDGFVIRQTANGWQDEQRQDYPAPEAIPGQAGYDMPRVPDAVLALLISPEGEGGWAVGGNTGELGEAPFAYLREAVQTGSVMRYGPGAAPPENSRTAPIAIPTEAATFAIGGGAECVGPCAALADTGIGPDVWLRSAVAKAAGIGGVRSFLYTGGSVAPSAAGLNRFGFAEEEAAYARRLGSAAGSLPVFTTPAPTDLYGGSLATFASAFGGLDEPLGSVAPPPGSGVASVNTGNRVAGNYSYAFESTGSTGGPVRVAVVDTTSPDTEAQCWLAEQLALAKGAKEPAVVLGHAEPSVLATTLTGTNAACPKGVGAAASAYFFASPSNVHLTVTGGAVAIPAYGTGTLGYTEIGDAEVDQHTPASGFLLASVDTKPQDRNETTNVAPVSAALQPSIGSLALDATEGTLLRRSQVALFEALARRPLAGTTCTGNDAPRFCDGIGPDPYVQIPDRCLVGVGNDNASCADEMLAEYRFTSSRPDIADFVEVSPTSSNPRAAYFDEAGMTVPDPHSGLLCAYNAGTTTVTIEAGGLAYSIPVTVQPGSVERPCGTVPLKEKPTPVARLVVPPPPPPPSPSPTFSQPHGTLPPPVAPTPTPAAPPVAPPAPVAHPVPHPAPKPLPQPAPPPPFVPVPLTMTPVVLIVPPPPAPAVEPTPPSGTSPVTQPAVSPKSEEEDEAAIQHVHHFAAHGPTTTARQAATRLPGGGGETSVLLLVMLAMGALSGSTMLIARRRPRPVPAHVRQPASRRHHR